MSEPESLRLAGPTTVLFRGRKYAWFAGCDYFRLASHPKILRAVTEGIKRYGLNVAASRVTTGNHPLYGKLENAMARFFGAPAALLVSNGYAGNSVVAQTVRNDFTHVFMDTGSHASMRDASRFFAAPVKEFKNCDPADLRRLLARGGRRAKPIVLTDGVFNYNGKIAPLAEYARLMKPFGVRGMILVDDAHGSGVIGKSGRGTLEFNGVSRVGIVQTVTLSKGVGVYGGGILCSRELRERIFGCGAMFAGGTPLPLPLVNGALCALEILRNDAGLHERLRRNVEQVKSALGLPLTPVPVIPIHPTNSAQAKQIRRSLLAHRVYPTYVQYPGPVAGYYRFAISSEHKARQLNDLVAALTEVIGPTFRRGRDGS
jgi:7-keto-8-aminopelargonate synthetase-like enzyme